MARQRPVDSVILPKCNMVMEYFLKNRADEFMFYVSNRQISEDLGLSPMEVRVAIRQLQDLGRVGKMSGFGEVGRPNGYKVYGGRDPVYRLSPVAENLLNLLWAVDIVHGPNWKIARTLKYSKEAIAVGWSQLKQTKMVHTPDWRDNKRQGIYMLTPFGRREAERRNQWVN